MDSSTPSYLGLPSLREAHPQSDEGRTLRATPARRGSSMDDRKVHSSDTAVQPPPSKAITFPLLLSNSPEDQARVPLRVKVNTHDTTESIISTVKNFYGLYEGSGVAFQDSEGNTIIPRYENLTDNTTVSVRVTKEVTESVPPTPSVSSLPQTWGSNNMPPPWRNLTQHSYGGVSAAASPQPGISPQAVDSRRRSVPDCGTGQGNVYDGASDSDGGNMSVSSSKKAKSDNVTTAEISVENIVEGGRRQRAKFASSELPLYVPPQIPMSSSAASISPLKRLGNPNAPSPLPNKHQAFLPYPHLPSPQSYGHTEPSLLGSAGPNAKYGPPSNRPSRRSVPSSRLSGVGGPIFPTPDPTTGGSTISDEDAALQLMRLGDASNFSHGRTSASTVDDALSGKAEAPSSAEESDEGDEDGGQTTRSRGTPLAAEPPRKKQKGAYQAIYPKHSGEFEEDFYGSDDQYYPKHAKGSNHAVTGPGVPKLSKPSKSKTHASEAKSRPKTQSLPKAKVGQANASKIPPSPYSVQGAPRKASDASTAQAQPEFGTDEEDLSAKPRCQRCRKSKKGCDRQRPCQRCKDAGIGVEGCVSEDEGNGRKGRFGRIMGVPVKKDGTSPAPQDQPSLGILKGSAATAEKSKKRKK
ncbi:MAG: hypothetical protein M1831_004298 [Alyxoria varia]|nr:MAG: hypothetical protein M1831_004298 [Alyxoria varia]